MTRRTAFLSCLILVAMAGPLFAEDTPATEVLFSPKGGCTRAVVQAIEQAKTSIRVQAKVLSSPSIGKALVDAQHRQVDVLVLLDAAATQDAKCIAPTIMSQGVKVQVDSKHKACDSRNIIIDDSIVLTGSFDLSPEAELLNAATLVMMRNQKEMAAKFAEHFKQCAEGAIDFKAAPAGASVAAPTTQKSDAGTAKASDQETPKPARRSASKKGDSSTKIDPNTASKEELMKLPRVGPAMADKIIAYREANGSPGKPAFQAPEDMRKVKGIGVATLAGMADMLTFPGGAAAEDKQETPEAKDK